MLIQCLGLSHHTASLSVREPLAFQAEALNATLAQLGCGGGIDSGPFNELVILSTCNRVELYATAGRPCFDALEHFLSGSHGVAAEQFRPYLYRHQGGNAVSHLFRVAAGLDSQVLGEPQILGQVTEALSRARSHGTSGKVLGKLFQAAIHAGKRARTETAISRNPASIASLAVTLARQATPDLAEARVVLLGAGEMAEAAVESLRQRGARHLWVINRTLDRARRLAAPWQGRAGTFENLGDSLVWADVVISSTGAPHTVVHPPVVLKALAGRELRPLILLDIAVPRDIDPSVGELAGVRLFDIDSLEQDLERSLASRRAEVPKVEALLAEELEAFLGYLRTLEVVPLIAELREHAESIRRAELDKTLRRLPHLASEDQERLEALTQALVKKLLHKPIHTLRLQAGGPEAAEYTAVAREIYGLGSQPAHNADGERGKSSLPPQRKISPR